MLEVVVTIHSVISLFGVVRLLLDLTDFENHDWLKLVMSLAALGSAVVMDAEAILFFVVVVVVYLAVALEPEMDED